MVPVAVEVSGFDLYDPEAICRIISVSSSEPEDGLGDGDTARDWEITGNLMVNLRAERSGAGDGRIYTITVECADASGNIGTGTTEVTVPHDRAKRQKVSANHYPQQTFPQQIIELSQISYVSKCHKLFPKNEKGARLFS